MDLDTEARPSASTRSVRAVINYIPHMAQEPYIYYRVPPEGQPYSNVIDEAHEVEIADMRGAEGALDLERDGVEFLKLDSAFRDFDDDEAIRAVYYPEIEAFYRRRLGDVRVIAWDFSIRRPDHGPARPGGAPVGGTRRRPIRRAHGDFVHDSARAKIRTLYGDEADVLLKGRIRSFNLWRALSGPLTDAPLAVCMPRTVAEDDLTPYRQHQEGGRENVICGLHHNPAHRWCYLSGMLADEAVVFTSYDSNFPLSRGVAFHCAFDDPDRPADGLARHSMEVRVMVLGG